LKDEFVTALRHYLLYIRSHPSAALGTVIVLVFVLTTIFAPLIAPYDPETPTAEFRTPPSSRHWFGTDPSGLDVFSRVVYAARVDLVVGITGTVLSMVIGIPLGLLVGYYRSFFSGLVLRIADLLQAFPVFVLAMAVVAIAGPSIRNVILVIGILNVPIYVRLVRSQVLAFRERPAIEAARCVGNSDRGILRHYLFPNTIEAALVQSSVNVGWAILLTASLSFIGAGVPVPTAEWGSMVGIGAPMMILGEWWAAFFPGLAIGLCVLGFAMVTDAIRVLVNPERRA
jgi:peptide/nickel transport system permease protein